MHDAWAIKKRIPEAGLPLVSRPGETSVVWVRDVPIGGGDAVVMAGPCSVESREQVTETAIAVKPPLSPLPCSPGKRSATMAVPSGVPSVRHNSRPCTPSSAVNSMKLPIGVNCTALALTCCAAGDAATTVAPADVPSVDHS